MLWAESVGEGSAAMIRHHCKPIRCRQWSESSPADARSGSYPRRPTLRRGVCICAIAQHYGIAQPQFHSQAGTRQTHPLCQRHGAEASPRQCAGCELLWRKHMSGVHQTISRLRELRLTSMAEAYSVSCSSRSFTNSLSTDSGCSSSMKPLNVTRRSEAARAECRIPESASLEDADYRASRDIDKGFIASLASCEWIRQQLNLIVLGATGSERHGLHVPSVLRLADSVYPLRSSGRAIFIKRSQLPAMTVRC